VVVMLRPTRCGCQHSYASRPFRQQPMNEGAHKFFSRFVRIENGVSVKEHGCSFAVPFGCSKNFVNSAAMER
jgi:hypothetical protein